MRAGRLAAGYVSAGLPNTGLSVRQYSLPGEQYAEAQLLAARARGRDSGLAVGRGCAVTARAIRLDDSQLGAGRQVRPAWALGGGAARGFNCVPSRRFHVTSSDWQVAARRPKEIIPTHIR
jgi:hypothetical protein